MAITVNRRMLKAECRNRFGSSYATDEFVARLEAKLGEFGIRLPQLTWVGSAGPGHKFLALTAAVPKGREKIECKLRFNSELEVVSSESKAIPSEDLGFGSGLGRPNFSINPRRQMGDYNN